MFIYQLNFLDEIQEPKHRHFVWHNKYSIARTLNICVVNNYCVIYKWLKEKKVSHCRKWIGIFTLTDLKKYLINLFFQSFLGNYLFLLNVCGLHYIPWCIQARRLYPEMRLIFQYQSKILEVKFLWIQLHSSHPHPYTFNMWGIFTPTVFLVFRWTTV